VVGSDGIVRYINPAAEALFGRKEAEFVDQKFDFPLIAGETREVNIRSRDDLTIVAEMRVSETQWEAEGVFLATLRDVTEAVHLREQLHRMSYTDEMTGLYNHRGFFALAERQLKLAGRDMQKLMLFYADVDNLKIINDSYGHQAGDAALKDITSIFRATFRETDIIGRIGGDEFVILALSARLENSAGLIARLRNNMKTHNRLGQREYNLSASIGVAEYNPEEPCSIDELLVRADTQMYWRKQDRPEAEARE